VQNQATGRAPRGPARHGTVPHPAPPVFTSWLAHHAERTFTAYIILHFWNVLSPAYISGHSSDSVESLSTSEYPDDTLFKILAPALTLSLFSRGLSCPHSVQTSLTQKYLELTILGFPYNLLLIFLW
jgi:hypothetical protein